jgi:uncharacterized protein YukJ
VPLDRALSQKTVRTSAERIARAFRSVSNPPGRFDGDNGIWQDGALFINLPAENPQERWVALFIAFQTQSWDTNNDGNPQITRSVNQSR